jgi:DNA segregation ATPase FtsK/SpoIIIE, S-DNA-T family
LEFTPQRRIIDASVRAPRRPDGRTQLFPEKKAAPLESAQFPGYTLPGLDLLEWNDSADEQPADRKELIATQQVIIDTLASFGIEVLPGDITRGPTVTRYEIYPRAGLRVSRIVQLDADIARSTCAERIHIIAPIPGKDTVGIEIANNNKVLVPLREMLEDATFAASKKKIPLALGKDVYGNVVVGDLAAMPHLLVAGATGSGKSVCINSIIASMLFRFTPDELRLIMIDPKVVEMAEYNTLPHLVAPVVTDPKKVVQALRWVVNEMERRYRMFAKVMVRNFDAFNKRPPAPKPAVAEPVVEKPEESPDVDLEAIESLARALEEGDLLPEEPVDEEIPEEEEIPDRIPYIVVIIDELADLMQTASADVEMLIARIAQKARAAGIHLIIATQTPRSTVITGVIKANIPSRIAFQVSSGIDSRVILDTNGAEKLVGKGDMLYLPPGTAQMVRCQGAFITDEEVHHLVKHCSGQGAQKFESRIEEVLSGGSEDGEEEVTSEDEEMLQRCVEVIVQEKRASTSLLQRRLRLGYTRAARMMDLLEARGYVGPGEGAKPREVLIR